LEILPAFASYCAYSAVFAQQVLKYLARYTHRVAIFNRRLVALENGSVTFRWKDYAKQNQLAMMTLRAAEFIRRFLWAAPRKLHQIEIESVN
jgi:hypothetical protein